MGKSLSQYFSDIIKNEIAGLKQIYPGKRYNESLDNVSSLGIKYPKFRDHPLHSTHLWLESKRLDDGAEGLWRVHDGLYDFADFIRVHPGGQDWLKLTRGTDITEAFEAHHLSTVPSELLKRYYIRKANTPRNSPFTFHENDFYNVLRRKICEKMKTLPKDPANRSKYITDLLFCSYVGLAILAACLRNYWIGAIAGILLALTAIASHNFFHQRDNFRMHYFDFTMMQSREWRVGHALSHHIYTNTVYDFELSAVEPFLQYLPGEKTIFYRYLSWLYSPIVYAMMYSGQYVKLIIQLLMLRQKLPWEVFLPFTVLIAMLVVSRESVISCGIMFMWIITISSIYFGTIGVNAAHHHPEIFHDGDAARPKDQMDWGLFQMDTVMDRKDINSSLFLVLTNFGDHTLHHLFPTVDHAYLPYLYPEFFETCKQFGVEFRLRCMPELVKGQYRQLAKVEPNPLPPGAVK